MCLFCGFSPSYQFFSNLKIQHKKYVLNDFFPDKIFKNNVTSLLSNQNCIIVWILWRIFKDSNIHVYELFKSLHSVKLIWYTYLKNTLLNSNVDSIITKQNVQILTSAVRHQTNESVWEELWVITSFSFAVNLVQLHQKTTVVKTSYLTSPICHRSYCPWSRGKCPNNSTH